MSTSHLRQLSKYLIVSVLSVGMTLLGLHAFPLQSAAAAPPTELAQASVPTPASSRNFVASAIQRVGPAVVRLDTERTVARSNPFADDPFFRRFFGNEGLPEREFQQNGLGSGFIVDESGIILTNAHVVSGADTVTAILPDGRRFAGEVRGADELSDLAVVKIDGSDLPVAPLGDSSTVSVGDWAIAVGNPLGLDNTVTLGIVSTLDRSSSEAGIPDKRLDFIQTDAAINPGNSGGPLVNDRGEVVGINTAIRRDGRGIGFAIPIDRAKAIKDRLARGEKIPNPFVGIRMTALTPERARQINADPNSSLRLPEVNGVLVVDVVPNGPAARAGMRRGDVITEIGGDRVTDAEQLQDIVSASQIGEPLNVTVQRDNQTTRLAVRPADFDEIAFDR